MAAGDLTSLANGLQWLGLSADDGTVARLITALSSAIQTFLGYQVTSQSYTRTFNGVGGRRLMLPDPNVTAVASVTIDDLAIPASTSAFADGYVFDDRMIYLRGCYEFCRGAQNIAVSYTAGLPSVPGDIEEALLDWLKLTHETLDDLLPGVTEMDAGDTKIKYGDTVAKLGNSTILMPPIIAAKLQPYRRMAPA